jgi:hypothetical protein
MKTLATAVAVLALAGVAYAAEVNDITVKASGITWKNGWGKAILGSLKRLEGAKETVQDDFSGGIGTYVVSFGATPKTKPSDVKKVMGAKYKIEGVRAKITAAVAEKDGALWAGDYKLADAKGESVLKDVKAGGKYELRGDLSEDDKGAVTLALVKAEAK